MASLGIALLLSADPALAQETLCARVKIEIKQELTLERQAFDAEMKIHNTLDAGSLTDVGIIVSVTDEAGAPVLVSSDPNNTTAKFFLRVSNKQNILNVDGSGAVAAATTATINWLLIPAPGSAGASPFGKKYLIGATLSYTFNGEQQTLAVSPDVITVKPLPLLTLDYFLTRDVIADDPMTQDIEAIEPFTLGVRVKNTGMAPTKKLKIDSAQPKIIRNDQGLLINFRLSGSYLDDAPVQNTLLIDFGDIAANSAKMGRWLMETTLSGRFTEFDARFSHSDELGGALTSIMQATNAHFLLRDVRVDLPGRDLVRDFLGQDVLGGDIKVYESHGLDTLVTDRSASTVLTAESTQGNSAIYQMSLPATSGFVYARKADPFSGQKALGQVIRSDGKALLSENIWLSKTKNPNTNTWEYWVSLFDANTPGSYTTEFVPPPEQELGPVIQFIADRVAVEGEPLSFIVEASSPNGKPVTLSAAPLPSGASFTQQPSDPQNPGLARATFSWTPAGEGYGNYLVVYTAGDGDLSSTKSATITINIAVPAAPEVQSPITGVHVATTRPDLIVRNSTATFDRTAKIQFEIYRDAAMSDLADSALVNKGTTVAGAGTTSFTPANDLNDNTMYWWRARAFDGADIYSDWVYGRFFTNLFNDAPDLFNLSSPAPNIEVDSATPTLVWSNTADKDEGDTVRYSVYVYSNAGLTQLVVSALNLIPADGVSTSWTVNTALTNHAKYWWKVVAFDNHGSETHSPARPFTINTQNTAPPEPVILSPGSQTTTSTTALTIQNGTDAESDPIHYVFELDTVTTFDSGAKRTSGELPAGAGGSTAWTVDNLIENQVYWWRSKALDGRAESQWTVGTFRMNAVNDAPPTPTIHNPGDGAWTGTLTPILEANAVTDPEEETVSYEFQVHSNTTLVASGSSTTTTWTVSSPLADKTTHKWRVRAVDVLGAASGWSAEATLYVSTGAYQTPSIQVTSPSQPSVPTLTGGRKKATISWTGTNNNIEPTVDLYYSTSNSGYTGSPIIQGIKKSAGTHTASYEWDVTDLNPGAYYVYGVIYDSRGVGKAYAPGAIVVPNVPQLGQIVVTAASDLRTSEQKPMTINGTIVAGSLATFTVRLANPPTSTVIVPIVSSNPHEGTVLPATLTFTPQNWNTNQTVTVSGVNDCEADGNKQYQVIVGKAISVDPNYIELSANPVTITNDSDPFDVGMTTNNPNVNICLYTVVSSVKSGDTDRVYTLQGKLTNSGPSLTSVRATLKQRPAQLGVTVAQSPVVLIEPVLNFGAAGTSESVTSSDDFQVKFLSSQSTDASVRDSEWLLLHSLISAGHYWEVVAQ